MAKYETRPFKVMETETEGIDMIKIVSNIKANETVSNGYGDITAPEENGTYSLWQLVDDNNCHQGFRFEKEN